MSSACVLSATSCRDNVPAHSWSFVINDHQNTPAIQLTLFVSSPPRSASSRRFNFPSYSPLNSPSRLCICPPFLPEPFPDKRLTLPRLSSRLSGLRLSAIFGTDLHKIQILPKTSSASSTMHDLSYIFSNSTTPSSIFVPLATLSTSANLFWNSFSDWAILNHVILFLFLLRAHGHYRFLLGRDTDRRAEMSCLRSSSLPRHW